MNDDGNEIDVYTADELAAEKIARETAEGRVTTLTDDLVKMKTSHKGEIKKLADMSEEEKAKLTIEQQQNMARIEQLEGSRAADLAAAKERMLQAAAKGDPKTLEKLREKYAVVQMPDSNVEEIAARINSVATWAYAELGITNNEPVAPTLPGGGENPSFRSNDDKPFSESEGGKKLETDLFGAALATSKQ